MKLWTIQSRDFYEKLLRDGVVFCDINKSKFACDDEDNQRSYKWITSKMMERIGENKAAEFPIWAWHTYDGKRKKPDLRMSCYAKPKTECVCLEIEIPDECVVLSDFDSWHNVLSNTFASLTENETDWDKENSWLDSLDLEEQQIEIEKSWDNVFKVDYFENDWSSRGLYIQATFWELKLDQVRKVKYFKAR